MLNDQTTFHRIIDEMTKKGFLDTFMPGTLMFFQYTISDFFREYDVVSGISDLLIAADKDLQASIDRRMLHKFTIPLPTIPEQAKDIGEIPPDYEFLLCLHIFIWQHQNQINSDKDIIVAIRYTKAVKAISMFYIKDYLSIVKNITNPKEVILCDNLHLYHIPS